MQTILIHPPPAAAVIHCRPPRVLIGGVPHPELQVIEWQALAGAALGSARLALHPASSAAVSAATYSAIVLPAVGTEVTIAPAAGDCGAEFHGRVAAHVTQLDESGVTIVELEHRLAQTLRQTLSTRWQLRGGAPTADGDAELVFNGTRREWASAALYSVGGRNCRIFDSSASTQPWSVADALAYLLAAGLPADVASPSAGELATLMGEIPLASVTLTGAPLGEALAEVAAHAGLQFRADQAGAGLVFYRPGVQGRPKSIRLQPPGATFSPAMSNVWRGRVVARPPRRTGLLALGGRKRHESTFTLAKGWDPSLESERWRDFVPEFSPDWTTNQDVFRTWVLNEHGWYSGPPWNLPMYSFAGLSADDFPQPAARRFLPCLSADISGRSLGVVVEVRCGSQGEWARWSGPVWVADDQCAVYLDGPLPAEYFQAAGEGLAAVRVTACVEADARLRAEVAGDAGCPRAVIDCSATAGWAQVHASSVFHGAAGLGPASQRDDTAAIERIALRRAQSLGHAGQTEIALGWIDASYGVGDQVSRIDGRGLALAAGAVQPSIHSVHHDFASQSTRLIIKGQP